MRVLFRWALAAASVFIMLLAALRFSGVGADLALTCPPNDAAIGTAGLAAVLARCDPPHADGELWVVIRAGVSHGLKILTEHAPAWLACIVYGNPHATTMDLPSPGISRRKP